jgi:hypothetical protein
VKVVNRGLFHGIVVFSMLTIMQKRPSFHHGQARRPKAVGMARIPDPNPARQSPALNPV